MNDENEKFNELRETVSNLTARAEGEPTETEHEHCYNVACPFTDEPATVGRVTDLLIRERAAARTEVAAKYEERLAVVRELADKAGYERGLSESGEGHAASVAYLETQLSALQARHERLVQAARNVVQTPLEHDCNHLDVVWDLQAAVEAYKRSLVVERGE